MGIKRCEILASVPRFCQRTSTRELYYFVIPHSFGDLRNRIKVFVLVRGIRYAAIGLSRGPATRRCGSPIESRARPFEVDQTCRQRGAFRRYLLGC